MRIDIDATRATRKLENIPIVMRRRLLQTVAELTERLRVHVVDDKLSGQVLHMRTGTLALSIKQRMEVSSTKIVGVVFSSGVPYARIQEYGGRTAAHVIEAKAGGTLAFMMNGRMVFRKKVFHPGSTIPERSYMRSSLDDMREDIILQITAAAREGAAEGAR